MPTRRRHILPTALALACLLPASAAAQDPGDEQYEDPFGSEEQSQPTPEPQPESAPAPAPAPEQEQQPAQPSQPAPAPATAAQAGQPQLPRTGADPGLVGLAGAGLVMAGVGLRLRLRAHGGR
jgi:outer membrane biosynthesis protein TonB